MLPKGPPGPMCAMIDILPLEFPMNIVFRGVGTLFGPFVFFSSPKGRPKSSWQARVSFVEICRFGCAPLGGLTTQLFTSFVLSEPDERRGVPRCAFGKP